MPLTTSTALVRAEGLDHNFGDVDSADRGRQGMKALPRVKAPSTAVVATSDMYAIGARTAVHDEGLQVPQDMCVVSFDDIMITAFRNPPADHDPAVA